MIQTEIVVAVIATLLLAVSSAAMLGANTMLLTFIPLHFSKIGRAATVTGMLTSSHMLPPGICRSISMLFGTQEHEDSD